MSGTVWDVHTRYRWAVTEQYTCAKGDKPNEDRIVTTGWCVAVIDGATDKARMTYHIGGREVTSGMFVAHVLADTLETMPTPASATEMVNVCTQILNTAILAQHPNITAVQRPCASLTLFNTELNQLWWVGDCQSAYIDDGQVVTHSSSVPTDAIAGAFRAAVNIAAEQGGETTPDPGREAIQALLARQNVFANTEHPQYGYGTFNGIKVPAAYIHTATLPKSAEKVVLATDGYPQVATRTHLYTIEEAEQALAHLLVQDPNCVHLMQSTKGVADGANSFDDRTLVTIEWQKDGTGNHVTF